MKPAALASDPPLPDRDPVRFRGPIPVTPRIISRCKIHGDTLHAVYQDVTSIHKRCLECKRARTKAYTQGIRCGQTERLGTEDHVLLAVIGFVATELKLRPQEVRGKRRPRRFVLGRKLAMAITCRVTRLTLKRIGQAFGCGPSRVFHARANIRALVQVESFVRQVYEAGVRRFGR